MRNIARLLPILPDFLAVQIVDAPVASVGGMHHQVMIIDNFKTPGLLVVTAGGPARQIQIGGGL